MTKFVESKLTLGPNSEHLLRLAGGAHADPFAVLGRHAFGEQELFRCFLPRTKRVWLGDRQRPMRRVPGTDLFECVTAQGALPAHYLVIREDDDGRCVAAPDPYSFWPQLDEDEMNRFRAGEHRQAQQLLGARRHVVEGISGTLFAVWAPNAASVSVIGDFNRWDGRCNPMRLRPAQGIWELFIPQLASGRYKYEIRNAGDGQVRQKADPYARESEYRPDSSSRIPARVGHHWGDDAWQRDKAAGSWHDRPMSVYEVHLGSWRRNEDGSFMGYRRLAEELCAYVSHLGFTHVELMPITEHPLDESWGYQTTGYFSPTRRFGGPDDLRAFVDHFHRHGIGVILDWVPAHFPRDEHALAAFDGTALYEYHEPLKAEHRDWGTLIFNYERREVRSFLISSALYWLQEFHLDGLRVDAVASMLYLDFSRRGDHWVPNRYGGNHNLEAIDFIRQLNEAVGQECPGCVTIAEESTDWPGVTRSTASGGLGFGLKWNMGWMHDTLDYFRKDPVHRRFHQDLLTFGPLYAFDEDFMLPLSHDEVVHLKKSLFGRMPGDEWQKFANLRLLYAYQWLYPGKKLLFMGGEFAQDSEWNSATALPWGRSREPLPAGVARLLGDLNAVQARHGALHQWDCDARGFEWLNGEDREQSVISFVRRGEDEQLIAVFNFTPVLRPDYRIPLPAAGEYRELFNSDLADYGGSDLSNSASLASEAVAMNGREHSLRLCLPPLGALLLRCQSPACSAGVERQISRS